MTADSSQLPLVAPFTGERYADQQRLGDLIAPPYDVISEAAREVYAARDAHNIVHLILPEGGDDSYAQAGRLLWQWRDSRALVPDPKPSLTVLRQEFSAPGGQRHVRTGVIGGVAVEPFSDGRVKPHEKTHKGPKEDRLALLRATRSMFETLFMVTRDESGRFGKLLAEAIEAKPLASAELLGVVNTLWRVGGRKADAMAAAAGAEPLYIADGHHRYETAVAYRSDNPSADRVPAVIVPGTDPGMVVLATHRMVYGGPINEEAFLSELRERFQIRELRPQANYEEELASVRERGTASLLVLPGGRALALLLKGGASLGDLPFANEPAVATLDVARVDEIVVKRALAMAGKGARVGYSADPHQVIEEVLQGEASAGVLLNPTRLEQVMAVADAGSVMPPKSTYFMPKVPSGLVVLGY
jgi:uncharacterized protein (DUF1015 family)